MTIRDLQTLNLDQVMFNSLVFAWERKFEVTFGIFSVLATHINVNETVLKLVMIKIVIIYAFKSRFYNISSLPKKYSNDLSHFLLNFSADIFQIESRKPHQPKVFLALI